MTHEIAEFIENKVLDAFIKEGKTEFEVNNNKITIMVNADVNVWCDNGITSICTIDKVDLKADRQRAINKVLKSIIEACDGWIRCSDCGKKIKKSEIAGHYFAGAYCQNCWNTKWKAIEANETYD